MIHRRKSNYSAPADPDIVDDLQRWHAVVTGIGDRGSCSSCSLHDSITAERLGIPAMAVMTTRFVSAAELMARVLGFPGYRFAVIAHPISSASNAALGDMAAAATAQARELLLQGSAGT